MADLVYQSATAHARLIREGRVSSREVLAAFLNRIDRLNGPINAVVTLDRENAERRAAEADEALARVELWGPPHGLPMTVKDGYNTRGVRTTLNLPLGMYNCPSALAGTPRVVIPAGLSSTGLPVGIQIGARRWHDARLPQIAIAMESLIATEFRPPGF